MRKCEEVGTLFSPVNITDNNMPNCKERKGISAIHSKKEAIY